jgi:hypothetical protein
MLVRRTRNLPCSKNDEQGEDSLGDQAYLITSARRLFLAPSFLPARILFLADDYPELNRTELCKRVMSHVQMFVVIMMPKCEIGM